MESVPSTGRWRVRVATEPVYNCKHNPHYVVYDSVTEKDVPMDWFHTKVQADTQADIYNRKGGPFDWHDTGIKFKVREEDAK